MVVDVPVMMQGQVSTTQLVQKTREVSQTQHIDKVAEIPVMMQRQIPMECEGAENSGNAASAVH